MRMAMTGNLHPCSHTQNTSTVVETEVDGKVESEGTRRWIRWQPNEDNNSFFHPSAWTAALRVAE